VGDVCGGATEGCCCGVAAAGGDCDVDGVVCGNANDTKKMNGARKNLKERLLMRSINSGSVFNGNKPRVAVKTRLAADHADPADQGKISVHLRKSAAN
jgi:hypothetical protein